MTVLIPLAIAAYLVLAVLGIPRTVRFLVERKITSPDASRAQRNRTPLKEFQSDVAWYLMEATLLCLAWPFFGIFAALTRATLRLLADPPPPDPFISEAHSELDEIERRIDAYVAGEIADPTAYLHPGGTTYHPRPRSIPDASFINRPRP